MPRGKPGTITHGHSGYNHGCHCEVCVEKHREYAREQYRRSHATGGWVDARVYVEIFGALYRAGESIVVMANYTGLDRTTVRNLCLGERQRVTWRTAQAARKVVDLLPAGMNP